MKNDVIKLNIQDITPEGFGVGRADGKVVFVANTAVGDVVEAVIVKELKSHSFAKLLSVLIPSQDRIESNCSVSNRCGGCVFRHISYDAELKIKQNTVKQAFARIAKMDITVNETVSASPEKYRNKVQYPFAPDANGKCVFGYYAPRSHRIVEHENCPLQDESFTEIARFCAKTADSLGISAFDEKSGRGILRHIVMRKSKLGEILVTLVVFKDDKRLNMLARQISSKFDKVVGIHKNLNSVRDNVIFGDKTERILGENSLCDELCGKKFELSPRAFYQVNAEMAEKLYFHAKKLAGCGKDDILLDLYCGVGTIGLTLAEKETKICGVEIIDDAIENARRNALLNNRSDENTLFVCGDAKIGVEQCNSRFGKPDIIILDPPRKGLDAEVIKTVVEASPKKIVYISCDVATLARDCAIFAERGYKTDEATPFDLFPRTGHVETVVLLSRQKYENEYEEYFMNRTVEDIMIEYSEQRDEWKVCRPKQITDESVCLLRKQTAI